MRRMAGMGMLIPLFALLGGCSEAPPAPLTGRYLAPNGEIVEFTSDGRFLYSGAEVARYTVKPDHIALTPNKDRISMARQLGPDEVVIIAADDGWKVFRVGSAAAKRYENPAPPSPPPSAKNPNTP